MDTTDPTAAVAGEHIIAAKRYLRGYGDPNAAFAAARDRMLRSVETIVEADVSEQPVIPEIDYAGIAGATVDAATVEAVRRSGCVIVRNVFPRSQAEEWNDELRSYLETNDYLGRAAARAGIDSYSGPAAPAAPQIYGVFWSRPQVHARQAPTMAATKRFLNHLYDPSAPMGREFDPDHDYTYADRVRRRVPGDTTLGLVPHMDAGSCERWLDPAYQRIYAPIFGGSIDDYDPWQAAFRTQTREFASPAVCSMYRTFQGWTALTPQGAGDGTLQLLPIAEAIAYVLLRALQPDVADDDLCGARLGRSLRALPEWHGEILPALTDIPLLEPGDTVWWHPDVLHAVDDEHTGAFESNVIYVGATPRCAKNEAYARRQAPHFLDGRSAPDFAADDYEVDFTGRATIDDLSDLGRVQMALTDR